jgi:hypothetical protein
MEKNIIDLVDYIDKNNIECLNASESYPVNNCLFDQSDSNILKSESDE